MSRSDSVSAQMGSMLLKGYKMLSEPCGTCNSVLMQDRKGVIICVNCNLSRESEPSTTSTMEIEQNQPVVVSYGDHNESLKRKQTGPQPKEIRDAEEALLQEIKHATKILQVTPPIDVTERLAHVQFIRECAEAIKSLQGIRM